MSFRSLKNLTKALSSCAPRTNVHSPSKRRLGKRSRRGSIYVLVLGVAMIVATIGMLTLSLARIERRRTGDGTDLAKARVLAQSAVEHGMTVLSPDASWRANYTHDVWQPTHTLGSGSFKWKLVADSGDLQTPPTGAVKIVGQGAVANALQQYSAYVGGGSTTAQELCSYTSGAPIAEEILTTTKWWAQYFKPTLPADAIGWKVTSVEIRCRRYGFTSLGIIHARLYEPLPDNMPSSTMLDTVTVSELSLPTTIDWHEFTFSADYSHDPNEGMCLAFESTFAIEAMSFEYQTSGVTELDSGFIDGTPTWQTLDTNKSFLYRIDGTYSTRTQIVAGTWTVE